jgi:hypothetical protein
LIDRQAVLALEPADSAAERQAGEPRVRDDPARDGEPEGLRFAVELS